MRKIKELFTKGKFHHFILITVCLEVGKDHLRKTPLYKRLMEQAKKELTKVEASQDHSRLDLLTMPKEEIDKLKKVTRRSVLQLRNHLHPENMHSLGCSSVVLGTSALLHLTSPVAYSWCVGVYFGFVILDHIKTAASIRLGMQPWWSVSHTDICHTLMWGVVGVTSFFTAKHLQTKMLDRMRRQIILRRKK